MKHRGVEFAHVEIEAGLWQWRFQIGETVTTGTTKTVLVVKAKSAQIRINRVLIEDTLEQQKRQRFARPVGAPDANLDPPREAVQDVSPR